MSNSTSDFPEVSVVLCFYNEARFIDEAVQSVLNQSYSSWELILVDDGSTDESVEISKRYAKDYPEKIFYLDHPEHKNCGLSASRNWGIKHARGAYIALLDADDVWMQDKLAIQVGIMESHPQANVLLEASVYWNSWNNSGAEDVLIPIGVEGEKIYSPPALMLALYPLGKGAAPCPSGFMIRKSVFERTKFEESFRGIFQMYEDQAFLCKIYLRENVYINETAHNLYRQRPASLVSAVHEDGRYHEVRKYYLNWFEDFLKAEKFNSALVYKALRRALFPYRYPLMFMCYSKAKQLAVRALVKVGVLKYPQA